MQKSIFKKIVVLVGLLLFQPLLDPGSRALARRKAPPKAYSFIAEGGKASQGDCDGERQIPRRLKKLKEFSKTSSYMGSELQDPELPGKANEEMWKHFFRAKPSCNSVLAKTPSSIEETQQKTRKDEIPPDEDGDDAETETPSEESSPSATE